MHKINWCERGMKLADIVTNTVGGGGGIQIPELNISWRGLTTDREHLYKRGGIIRYSIGTRFLYN